MQIEDYENYPGTETPIIEKINQVIRTEAQKFTAVIVDVDDPDDKNRYKIRVAGVHPGDLPEDQLPWVFVQLSYGSNSGIGAKAAIEKGQYCTVKPLDIAHTDWIIIGGSNAFRKDAGDVEGGMSGSDSMEPILPDLGGGGVPNPDTQTRKDWSPIANAVLAPEFLPKIASGILEKIEQTVYNTINENLMEIEVGRMTMGGEMGGGFDEPKDGWPLIAPPINLTSKLVYQSPRSFDLKKYIKIRKKQILARISSSKYKITIQLNGVAVGRDRDGNPVPVKLSSRGILTIPGNVPFDANQGYSIMNIQYSVQSIKHPGNHASNMISVAIGKKRPTTRKATTTKRGGIFVRPIQKRGGFGCSMPSLPGMPKPGMPGMPNMMGALTPGIIINEIAKTSELGEVYKKVAYQLPNGMAFEFDGSDDNINMSIAHPAGARIEITHDGHLVFKANTLLGDMEMEVGTPTTPKPPKTPKTRAAKAPVDPFAPSIPIVPGDMDMELTPKLQILAPEGDIEMAAANLNAVLDDTINMKSPMTYLEGKGFVFDMTSGHIIAERVLLQVDDVLISGNLTVAGTISSYTDVLAPGPGLVGVENGPAVSLSTHTHGGSPAVPLGKFPKLPPPPDMSDAEADKP